MTPEEFYYWFIDAINEFSSKPEWYKGSKIYDALPFLEYVKDKIVEIENTKIDKLLKDSAYEIHKCLIHPHECCCSTGVKN